MQKSDWHTKSVEYLFSELKTSREGLPQAEAQERLKIYGFNVLPESKPDGYLRIFLRQFQSPLIYILLLVGAMVFAMGDRVDGSIIFFVLFVNAVIGVVQEGRAQNILLALKNFSESQATVIRDGKYLTLPDKNVVVGDIISLEEGEKIPADARVIFSRELKVDEASLTGESEAVYKNYQVIKEVDLPIADQRNMVFKGTHVVAGNGLAVVVAIGQETIVGGMSEQIANIDTEIPFKTNIRNFSHLIIVVIAVVCVAIFSLGMALGKPGKEMFATVVSLAVSIIPEGIAVVTTLVLAAGVWRMSKRNALVKRLQAVEALGQARVIAVDKTGTITKNEMMVQKVFVGGKVFDVGGVGYEPQGEIRFAGEVVDPLSHPELILMGQAAAFCTNGRTVFSEEKNKWQAFGDPTEVAMLVFAEKVGFKKNEMEKEFPLVFEIPFSYKNKYHATIHQENKTKRLTVVGAPEEIIKLSSKIWKGGRAHELDALQKEEIENKITEFLKQGLRVLAVAELKEAGENVTAKNISGLTLVGFWGMKDALKKEVKEALQKAEAAGIKVVMITGDHKITAQAIATEAGIFKHGDEIIDGQEIERLTDDELAVKLDRVSVFARANPDHKLKIINAYRKRGEVIAMTGDGVNDAPSLVAADLGVAMGLVGTEVAKEAADIILLDDNFGSIVGAIEEGRHIYKTIKKVILYLFSTSWGEVFTITGALFLGFPLPLLPAQIIWLNFVTDGFLDVALSMEPKDPQILRGKFERPKKYIMDKFMFKRLVPMALVMAVGTLAIFSFYFEKDLTKAWTISLTTLAVFQWFNVWNCRHKSKSVFKLGIFTNKALFFTTLAVIALQIFAMHNPVMRNILKTTPLSIYEWLMIIAVGSSIIFVEEIRKFFYRKSMLSPLSRA